MPPATQVDQQLAHAEKRYSADAQRAEMITRTRRFKSSWHELAEALTACQKGQLYNKWGYNSFEEYCRKELRLQTATVNKLVGNFCYLQRVAPEVLRRDGVSEPIPSAESVAFLRKSAELCAEGKVSSDLVEEVRLAVMDQGMSAPLLDRKFKAALFPQDDAAQVVKKRRDAARAANQLAQRLASLRGSLPEGVLSQASAAIDQLLAVLLASQADEPPPAAPACASAPAPAEAAPKERVAPEAPAAARAEEDDESADEADGWQATQGAAASAEDTSPPERRFNERVHEAHRRAVVYLCSLDQSHDEAALQRMRKGLLWHLKILSDPNLVDLATLFPAPQWALILQVAATDRDARRHLDRALGPQAWPGVGSAGQQPKRSPGRLENHSSAAA